MMDFIKYTFWPAMKVRLIYWWWLTKYGGKKNIPKELIFGQLEKSFNRLNENLNKAIHSIPEDISEKEHKELRDLLHESNQIEAEIEKEKIRMRKPN